MTWLNWHAPVITPAQGLAAIACVLALDFAIRLAIHFLRDKPAPVSEEERKL